MPGSDFQKMQRPLKLGHFGTKNPFSWPSLCVQAELPFGDNFCPNYRILLAMALYKLSRYNDAGLLEIFCDAYILTIICPFRIMYNSRQQILQTGAQNPDALRRIREIARLHAKKRIEYSAVGIHFAIFTNGKGQMRWDLSKVSNFLVFDTEAKLRHICTGLLGSENADGRGPVSTKTKFSRENCTCKRMDARNAEWNISEFTPPISSHLYGELLHSGSQNPKVRRDKPWLPSCACRMW